MHVRSPFAFALAALVAAAAPARAAPAATTSTPTPRYAIGGWIGYEMGDLSGLQLRGDLVLPFQKLTPQLDLSLVGSLGWSYLTDSPYGVDITGNLVKLVPAARFTYAVSPQLAVFGDAGLGLYWASVSYDYGSFIPGQSSSDLGVMLRFGVGAFYRVNPAFQVGAAVYLDPMFGGYEDNTFSILAGVTYRL